MNNEEKFGLTRRGFMRSVGLAGAVCVTGSGFLTPTPALADEVEALIATDMGAGAIAMEKVILDLPATAENGALVRIPVKVDHPMAADNFIQSVAIYVDANPKPLVGRFEFIPEMGVVQMEIRIKMAKASKVRVIAKNNKGQLFGAVKELQVAEGGCSG